MCIPVTYRFYPVMSCQRLNIAHAAARSNCLRMLTSGASCSCGPLRTDTKVFSSCITTLCVSCLFRSSRGGWLKTGRRRTGFKGGKNATAAAAAADEPTATASAAEPGGRPKTSGVLLAERYYAASFAATEAWYAEQDASAARAAAQRLRRRRENEQKEQRLLRWASGLMLADCVKLEQAYQGQSCPCVNLSLTGGRFVMLHVRHTS